MIKLEPSSFGIFPRFFFWRGGVGMVENFLPFLELVGSGK